MEQPIWRIRTNTILHPHDSFGIMGIINASPDSFSPNFRADDAKKALAFALRARQEGADILDLGGLSTRPGSKPCPVETECARLLPLLLGLLSQGKGSFISIDTWRAPVAKTMLELGAHIINDVSGAKWDPALMDILATYKPGYVLMHAKGMPETMQQNPHSSDIVTEVCHFFTERMNALTKAGLPEDHIVLDVGIGFGKTLAHNLALLRAIKVFQGFGRPLLIGLSMKSLFADLLGLAPTERATATMIATAILATRGVFWHRVHDVAEARKALLLANALATL